MKNIFILFLALLSSISYAQNISIADIQSDDNIPWAGEVMWDVSLDFSMEDKSLKPYGIQSINKLRTLKRLNNNPTTLHSNDLQLNATLGRNWKELPLYKDDNLKEVMSQKERDYIISRTDTTIILDLEFVEEIMKIFRTELNFDSIVTYQIKAIVYYDARTMDFKVILQTIGIPTYIKIYICENDSIKTTWMPINEWLTTLNLNSEDVTWATRLYRDLDFREIKPFKEKENISVILQSYFERLSTKMPPLHNTIDGSLLTKAETQKLIKSRDTIITFDPNTFEKILKVVVDDLNIAHISSLRIVLDWVWDDKKKLLYAKQIAYSPLREMYDGNGKFKYRYAPFIKYVGNKN